MHRRSYCEQCVCAYFISFCFSFFLLIPHTKNDLLLLTLHYDFNIENMMNGLVRCPKPKHELNYMKKVLCKRFIRTNKISVEVIPVTDRERVAIPFQCHNMLFLRVNTTLLDHSCARNWISYYFRFHLKSRVSGNYEFVAAFVCAHLVNTIIAHDLKATINQIIQSRI